MSGGATVGPPVSLRARRLDRRSVVMALVPAILFVLSILNLVEDRRRRAAANRFITRFSVDLRRPEYAETAALTPAGDLAADVLAYATLADINEPVNLIPLKPEVREAWLAAVRQREEQLVATRELLLDAVQSRPGWFHHHYMLGKIVYAASLYNLDPELITRYERWYRPVVLAIAGAPGDASAAMFLSAAALDTAAALPHLISGPAVDGLRRAFENPSLVTLSYFRAAEVLGPRRAASLLPDRAASVGAAMSVLNETGDVAGAIEMFPRWQRAERKSRKEDLRALEVLYVRGDEDGLREECRVWLEKHDIFGFDDSRGRKEVGRLLEVWPFYPGTWGDDPRTVLIRYFLDGRQRDAPGEAVAQASDILIGAPDVVRARARLLAGDFLGAVSLASEADFSPTDWTPYFIDLAEYHRSRGEHDEALEAVSRVAPASRLECEPLVATRAIYRSASRTLPEELASVEVRSSNVFPAGLWSSSSLSICLEPEADRNLALMLNLRAESPALIGYGWNGGQSVWRALPAGESTISASLEGLEGRSLFGFRVLAGGEVRPEKSELFPKATTTVEQR